jgi:hypothetical protein
VIIINININSIINNNSRIIIIINVDWVPARVILLYWHIMISRQTPARVPYMNVSRAIITCGMPVNLIT